VKKTNLVAVLLVMVFMGACGASGSGTEPSMSAAELRRVVEQALEAEGSFRFTLEMDSGSGDSPLAVGNAIGDGFYSFDGPLMSLTTEPVEVPEGAEGTKGYDQRLIGSDLYQYPVSYTKVDRIGRAPSDDYWLHSKADEPTAASGLPFLQQMAQFFKVPEGLEIEEEIAQGETTTYRGAIQAPDGGVAASQSATYEVTIDGRSLPREMVSTFTAPGLGELTISIAFKDFGATKSIEPPPHQQIVTLEEYTDFLEKIGAPVPFPTGS
jgi:hypothetical protein